jgi:hypothetical protein
MKKSDKSIRNITLAKVKCCLMEDTVCTLTRTYDNETMADISFAANAREELPVACTYVDTYSYTLITTRRIFTTKDGLKYEVLFQDIKACKFGDFKGMQDKPVTFGSVTKINGEDIPVLIESGKPSMIVVNAIRTILNLTEDVST